MSMQTMVRQEVKDQLEELHKLQVGTNEYKTTVDGVTKLMDKAIEMEKIDIELEEREKTREMEYELKKEQMKNEKKDRRVGHILSGAGVIASIAGTASTVYIALKSLKFEETGSITSFVGKSFLGKVFRK